MNPAGIFTHTSFLACLLGAVLFGLAHRRARPPLEDWAEMSLGVGFATTSTLLLLRGLDAAKPLVSSFFEALPFAAWAMLGLYLLLARRYRVRSVQSAAAWLAVVLTGSASLLPALIPAFPLPDLHSWLFEAYLALTLMATGGFSFAAVVTGLFLLRADHDPAAAESQPAALDLPQEGPADSFLPAQLAAGYDEIAQRLNLAGLALLALALFCGAAWSHQALGYFWLWRPREVAGLISLLFYAGALHYRFSESPRRVLAGQLSLVAFAAMLFACYQIDYLPWLLG